jgi:hypothetical protein
MYTERRGTGNSFLCCGAVFQCGEGCESLFIKPEIIRVICAYLFDNPLDQRAAVPV